MSSRCTDWEKEEDFEVEIEGSQVKEAAQEEEKGDEQVIIAADDFKTCLWNLMKVEGKPNLDWSWEDAPFWVFESCVEDSEDAEVIWEFELSFFTRNRGSTEEINLWLKLMTYSAFKEAYEKFWN